MCKDACICVNQEGGVNGELRWGVQCEGDLWLLQSEIVP